MLSSKIAQNTWPEVRRKGTCATLLSKRMPPLAYPVYSHFLCQPSLSIAYVRKASTTSQRPKRDESTASKQESDPPSVVVPVASANAFICRCLEKVGADPKHAKQMADVLIMGDTRGHFSHGLNRLDMYVNDLKGGRCRSKGEPKIVKEGASTALVDGQNLLGGVVGKFAMDTAIRKAKESGVGWVSAYGSNHYGIAGYYGLQAVAQGLIGISVTNTSPLCVPTRAKQNTLGTNPICFAAPGRNGDSFVLDMATTTVAIGKVELAMRKCQNIPEVWGVDKTGKPSTDPKKVYEEGGLLPLGGSEETGGYKGYGLNMMVEILCGILADAAFGPHVRSWNKPEGEARLGQGFIAVDPSHFAEGFQDRLQSFIDIMRHLPASDLFKPVLAPGDPERVHVAKCEKLGGIPYHQNQFDHAKELAQNLGVAPMEAKG
ncbi:hypothetical protein RvY_11102 [Ramazzottius varieornatus]|uniref:Malate dehydrogenase n=1 Tax=Ramazzottius varieornatus TaxID=947166 RepID=A0A1D1VF15_RAMVA|nr:hypothetical protein RvY_11102 [Ramazzottius varieornatus]